MKILVGSQKNPVSQQLASLKEVPGYLFKTWSRLQNMSHCWFKNLRNSQDLQVWQTCDRQGNHWWSAYDPATGRTIRYVSESQIRVWIEHRHL